MYILEKYLLLIIVSCIPAIPVQKNGTIKQEQQLFNKDSVSEIEVLNNPLGEILKNQTIEPEEQNNEDSTFKEKVLWKFGEHIILGN